MTDSLPLTVESLSKSFGKKQVLDRISLKVQRGKIFGLVGLNGVGKTTLIKIMLGLLKQDAGEVKILGLEPVSKAARKNLSYLPEKFMPSPFLKGSEFLYLSQSFFGQGLDKKQAADFAERFDLDPAALSSRISKYSKGMGQKLGLMSAFLPSVPLLILDEPMSGLDPKARILLKQVLLEYCQSGNTIFFSSHILADIDEICHTMAVLHDSRLIFDGTPAAFKAAYAENNLEAAFLKSISH